MSTLIPDADNVDMPVKLSNITPTVAGGSMSTQRPQQANYDNLERGTSTSSVSNLTKGMDRKNATLVHRCVERMISKSVISQTTLGIYDITNNLIKVFIVANCIT